MKNKGISLITLIITIVVVIILAAAVIFTLGNKNPVNDANLAALLSNKDNMQGKILFHVTKTAASLPEKDLNAKIVLIMEDDTKIIDTTVEIIEVTKDGRKINLYRIDKNKYKNNIKDDVAEKPSTGSEWYVDEYGNLFLVYDYITSVPNYMKSGNNLSKNVEDFVIIRGQLLEKSIIDSVVIGDKAENGILDIDVSKVNNFTRARIQINDYKTKLGNDENDYLETIINKDTKTVDIGMDKLGYRQAHVLVITTDATVEIIKEIEIVKPADVWDGTIAAGFAGGEGTEDKPFIIETAEQFAYFRNAQSSSSTYSQKHIKLINDIDLNDIEWMPIAGGNNSNNFCGIFEGDGHKIINIKITADNFRVGLFGKCDNATIKNLSVSGEISGTSPYIGGIAGYISGRTNIINCENHVNISRTDESGYGSGGIVGYCSSATANIIDCVNYGDIEGSTAIGGIVGYAEYINQIVNSHNEGNISVISGMRGYTGGIVGQAGDIELIEKCFNIGNVSGIKDATGGIIGSANMCRNLRYCYNEGNISNTTDNYAGGIIGQIGNTVNLSDCYNLGDVTSKKYSAGIVGYGFSSNAKVYNSYNKGNISVTSTNNYYGAIRSTGSYPYIYNSYYLDTSVDRVDYSNVAKVGEVESKQNANFIKGYTDSSSVTYLLNNGVTDDTRIWTTVSGVNDGYPILKWQTE